MTQVSIKYQVNPRFVPDDVPLMLGNAKDSAIIYDATADELSIQTQNASAVLTDRIRVESGTDTPFVEFAAGRLRLLDAAADPAAGEITRNGAHVKVYSGGAVRSLSDIGIGLSNVVEDTTPQLGGNLDMQANLLVGNGGSAGIAISSAGEVTMAAQPLVIANLTTGGTNETGDGTAFTVTFNTETKDQNADYASPTFTAPVTGSYEVSTHVSCAGITSAHTSSILSIITSNRTYSTIFNPFAIFDATNGVVSWVRSVIADMDAADTLTVTIKVTNGTKVADIQSSSYLMVKLGA